MYMSNNLYLKLDLGQSTVTTNSSTFTGAQTTLSVGKFANRYDTNNIIEIQRPTNNKILVQLWDNITNKITTEELDYVIQIFLEPI